MFNTIQWDKSKCKFDEFTGNSYLLYRLIANGYVSMSKSKHISLFVICINICLNLPTIPHLISHFYSFFLIVKCLKNNLSNNKI